MSDVPKKLVVDVAKGTQSYIDLTPEEIQQRELDAIAAATAQAEREAEEQAKAAAKQTAQQKLAALGLTDQEVTSITGL
jgi:2-methylcitrate dehydratase PrpD